jgi:hypothetical protein
VQGALRALQVADREHAERAHDRPLLLSPDAVLGILRAGRTTVVGGARRDETGKAPIPRSTRAHRP